MSVISGFWPQQMDMVFFALGLSHFFLAAITLDFEHLEKSWLKWSWFSRFALLFGAHAWLDMISFSFARPQALQSIQGMIAILAMLCLGEAIRHSWSPEYSAGKSWYVAPVLLSALCMLWGGPPAVCLPVLLVLPGCWFSAVLIWKYRRAFYPTSVSLAILSACLVVMGILAGPVTALMHRNPAATIPGVGIPVPVFEFGVMLAIGLCFWRHRLDSITVKLRSSLLQRDSTLPFFLLFCLGIGWLFTDWMGFFALQTEKEKILDWGKLAGAALHEESVSALQGHASERTTPVFRDLQQQLLRIQSAHPQVQQYYTLRPTPRGMVVTNCSRPLSEASAADVPTPGSPFSPVPAALDEMMRTRRPTLGGPFQRNQEHLFAGFVPLLVGANRDIQGILGLEVPASAMNNAVFRRRLIPILLTFVFCFLRLLLFVSHERQLSQQAGLQRSLDSLRSIFDQMSDALAVLGRDGEAVECNQRWLTLLHLTPEDMYLSRVWQDRLGKTFEEKFQRVRDSGFEGFETGINRPSDQSRIDLEITIRSMELAKKPVFLVTLRDVSIRKKIQEELVRRDMVLDCTANAHSVLVREATERRAMEESLAWIGEGLGLDRLTFYEITPPQAGETFAVRPLYGWSRLRGEGEGEGLAGAVPFVDGGFADASLPGWFHELERGRVVVAPAALGNSLYLPCMAENALIGFIKLKTLQRHREWSQVEQETLKTFGLSMGVLLVRNRMQEMIRKSEEKYRLLLLNQSDVIVILDASGRELFISESIERLTGYAPQECLGKNAFEFLHRDDVPRVMTQFKEFVASGAPSARSELRRLHKNGSYVHLEIMAVNLMSQPLIGGILVTMRDITERILAEEALRRSERRFRIMVQNLHDVISILDQNGTEVFVSDSVERLTGFTPAEMLGKQGFELIPATDIPRMEKVLMDVLAHPEQAIKAEYQHLCKNGGYVTVEATGVNLLHDPLIQGIVLVVRDISDRKLKEELARKTKEDLEALVRQRTEALLVANTELKNEVEQRQRTEEIVALKRDFAFALSQTTDLTSLAEVTLDFSLRLPGLEVGGFFWMDEEAGDLVLVASRHHSEAFLNRNWVLLKTDFRFQGIMKGIPLYFEQKDRPDLFDEDMLAERIQAFLILPLVFKGRVVGSIHLGSQTQSEIPLAVRTHFESMGAQVCMVMSRIFAEEEIRHALEREKHLNQMKTRFISVASHEFRTPMSVMFGAVELLKNHFDHVTPQKRLELLNLVADNINRLSLMLEDVLAINRLDSGRQKIQAAKTDLTELFRSLCEETQLGDPQEHKIMFCCERNVVCLADERVLRHVFTNLISNALRYSSPQSQINIELTREGEKVCFSIQDCGIGIPREDWERIFEPFERGSNVGTTRGTGLGLHTARRMVELHGGTMEFTSEVGKGTTFHVAFPFHSVK